MEGRDLLHCMVLSSILDLFTLDGSKLPHHTESSRLWQPKMSVSFAKWFLGGKLPLIENYCGKSCKIILPEPKTLVIFSPLLLLQHVLYAGMFYQCILMCELQFLCLSGKRSGKSPIWMRIGTWCWASLMHNHVTDFKYRRYWVQLYMQLFPRGSQRVSHYGRFFHLPVTPPDFPTWPSCESPHSDTESGKRQVRAKPWPDKKATKDKRKEGDLLILFFMKC